jgi:hypothetical protein
LSVYTWIAKSGSAGVFAVVYSLFTTIKSVAVCLILAVYLLFIFTLTPAHSVEEVTRAARSGDVGILQDALRTGYDLETRNADGFTPLMEAARAGNFTAARFLVEHNANLEARSPLLGTPLCLAALNGNSDIVDLLVDHGANPDATTDRGATPLYFAFLASEHSAEMTRVLVSASRRADQDHESNVPNSKPAGIIGGRS